MSGTEHILCTTHDGSILEARPMIANPPIWAAHGHTDHEKN